MRVLTGVVHMFESLGPNNGPWSTPQVREMWDNKEPEAFKEKVRYDRYDLNQSSAVSDIPNHDD